jgi:hypothetical protein
MKVYQERAANGHLSADNDLAWLLATSSDLELRDASRAVTYAEKAVAGTGRTNAMYLDTLAAAYAETGNFTKAVATQKEAMALLRTGMDNTNYASRLKLFESGLPFRQSEE